MREPTPMEHPRIDEERIVDRYLAGRLDETAEASFEEHLFVCADCLEQVEWGEQLRRGLRTVAAEETARGLAARGAATAGLLAWLARRRPAGPAARTGLALALLLVLALATVPALLWQRAELDRLREAGSAEEGAAGLATPTGDLQVVSLGVVRDAGEAVAIRPRPGMAAILLSLDLPPLETVQAAPAASYRVHLRDAASGETLWTGEGLEPSLYDTLLVALPASYLAPGRYRLTLEASTAAGPEPAGEVALEVLPGE